MTDDKGQGNAASADAGIRNDTAVEPTSGGPSPDLPDIGVHGADAPIERGGEASAMAREGAAKAFPDDDDSDYAEPRKPDTDRT
ncbi:MAG: hypothetical protein ACJ77N_17195 [Chloroflexota bacterium]|jgi:hypothetical protein